MEISKAINRLAPTAKFAVTNEDVNQIEWRSEDIEQPSNEAILAEAEVIKAEYDANKYQRDRELAYPTIGDQLDMQYWDKVNGTSTWQDAVAEVKSDFPKP